MLNVAFLKMLLHSSDYYQPKTMYRGIRLFLVILRACSITGSLDKAREIQDDIVKVGFHMVQSISNSLLMHGKFIQILYVRYLRTNILLVTVWWICMLNGAQCLNHSMFSLQYVVILLFHELP